MKNKQVCAKWITGCFLLLMISACSSEDEQYGNKTKPIEALTIGRAMEWYNDAFGISPRLKNTSDSLEGEVLFEPAWDLAQLFSDTLWYVVESPLDIGDGGITIMTKDVGDYADIHGKDVIKQVLKLIVLRNKETGDTYSFIMAVLPELNYMLRKGDKLDENKYLSRGSDLDGLVVFYTVDGEFINGWLYKDGKIAGGTDLSIGGKATKQLTAVYMSVVTCGYYSVECGSYTGGGSDSYTSIMIVYIDDGTPAMGGGGGVNINFPNIGGSGGSGGGSSGANGNPKLFGAKSKKIFRNSNMSRDKWLAMEKLINKIMEDCMGKAMYNGLVTSLNGKTLALQFVDGQNSYFDYTTGSIYLSNSMESNRLYHEMFHAYQAYGETQNTYNGSGVNLEIEAFYAQYQYLSNLPEYKGSKWEEWYKNDPLFESIKNLKEYVDRKGNLKSGKPGYQLDNYINCLSPISKLVYDLIISHRRCCYGLLHQSIK